MSLIDIHNHNSNVKSFSRCMFSEPIIPPIEKIVNRHNPGISCPDIFDKAVIPDLYDNFGISRSLCLSKWLLIYYLALCSKYNIVLKIHFWCWYKCCVLIFASVDIFDNWCVCPFWSLPVSSVALDQEKQSLLFQCYVYDWRCFLEYLEIFFLKKACPFFRDSPIIVQWFQNVLKYSK